MANERIANEILAAVKEWRHWVGNSMLDNLGVPDVNGIRDRDARFVKRLLISDDAAVDAMLEYFELGDFSYSNDVWHQPGFKLFVSHVARSKERVLPLAVELRKFGIHSFLAHEAIQPTRNWRDMLVRALNTMDALLSFHSEGFRNSEWCSQEVGYALGRGKVVVSVMDGELPSGIIGAFQGIQWNNDNPVQVADRVFELLIANQSTRTCLASSLARELRFAGTWDQAGFWIDRIARCGPLSASAKRSIKLALLLNDQVSGNEHAEALLGPEPQPEAASA